LGLCVTQTAAAPPLQKLTEMPSVPLTA
jgi:hypothetical protein